MSILSKNLKTIRKELRCTQSVMSEILKVGFRTYVRYEAGEGDAPVSVLVKIAKLGNLSLEQLLTVQVKSGVIQDFIPFHQTAMAVVGVFVNTHIGDDHHIGKRRFDFPHRSLDNSIGIIGFRAAGVLFVGNAE